MYVDKNVIVKKELQHNSEACLKNVETQSQKLITFLSKYIRKVTKKQDNGIIVLGSCFLFFK